ncbi:MAG: hypothetical protein WKF82_02740 [Nocardioidaceae bacterium]
MTSVRAQTCGGVPPWEGFDSDPSHFFAADSGPWRDLAVYPLHVISFLFGHIRSITATSRRTIDEFHVLDGPHRGLRVPVLVDDDWHASVVTEGGVIADLHVNMSVREPAALSSRSSDGKEQSR